MKWYFPKIEYKNKKWNKRRRNKRLRRFENNKFSLTIEEISVGELLFEYYHHGLCSLEVKSNG